MVSDAFENQNFVKYKSFESRSVTEFRLLPSIFSSDLITASRCQNKQKVLIRWKKSSETAELYKKKRYLFMQKSNW